MPAVTISLDNPFSSGSGQDPAYLTQPGVKLSSNLWVDPILKEVQSRPRFLCTMVRGNFEYSNQYAPMAIVPTIPGRTPLSVGTFATNSFSLQSFNHNIGFTAPQIVLVQFNYRTAFNSNDGFASYSNFIPNANTIAASGSSFYYNRQTIIDPVEMTGGAFSVRPWRNLQSGFSGYGPSTYNYLHYTYFFREGGGSGTDKVILPPALDSVNDRILGMCGLGGRTHLLSSEGVVYSSNVGGTDFTVGGFSLNLRGSGSLGTGRSFTSIKAVGSGFLLCYGLESSSVWELLPSGLQLKNTIAAGTNFSAGVVDAGGNLLLLNKEGLSILTEDIFKSNYSAKLLAVRQNDIARKFFNSVLLTQITTNLDGGATENGRATSGLPGSDNYLLSMYSSVYNAVFFLDVTNRKILYVYLGTTTDEPFLSIWDLTFDPRMLFRGLITLTTGGTGGSIPMLVAVEPFFNQKHYYMFLDTPDFRQQITQDLNLKFPEGSGFPNFYTEESFDSVFDTGPLIASQGGSVYTGLEPTELTLSMLWSKRGDLVSGPPEIRAGILEEKGGALIDPTLNLEQTASTLDVGNAQGFIPTLSSYTYREPHQPVRVPWIKGNSDNPRIIVRVVNSGPYRVIIKGLTLTAKYLKKRKEDRT